MTQPFLHQGQHLGIVARLGIEHALGIEAGLIETRREQVVAAHHPQHRAPGARRDPGDEQRRRRVVSPARARRRDLVQRIEPEPAIAQLRIDRRYAERQHGTPTMADALDRTQRFAKFG